MVATDINNARLRALEEKVRYVSPGASFETSLGDYEGSFNYIVVLAPVPKLVSDSVAHAAEKGLVNIFAGIHKGTTAELDLDSILKNRVYLFGTSGSPMEAMEAVLARVESGNLDTNISVDAIGGMNGAIEGLNGVKGQRFSGKVVIYPQLKEMGLITLSRLAEILPDVHERLADGKYWTKEAEEQLLSHMAEFRR